MQVLVALSVEEVQVEDRSARRAAEDVPAWVQEQAVDVDVKRRRYILRWCMDSARTRCRLLITTAISLLCLITSAASSSRAQSQDQKTFASSKDAVDALIQALKEGSNAELLTILGPDSEQIVSSGDEIADKRNRDKFVSEYEARHSLVETGPDQLTLNVGKNDWPLPIPLVHSNKQWFWDGAAGREELLYRRIGRNELSAIDVCKGVVAAQREYAAHAHDGQPAGTYASRIRSEAGKQDGLYWEVAAGVAPSPAGPLLARAEAEGYATSGKHTPYHGYYYRMLKSPGGFGFLAYPAQYRSSGVMTFIVDQTGIIYEKDLGEKTTEIGEQMDAYKRDNTWAQLKY